MKEKSRIETERKKVSRITMEMNEPRLTESVRNGFTARAAPAEAKHAVRSARAMSPSPCGARNNQFKIAQACSARGARPALIESEPYQKK